MFKKVFYLLFLITVLIFSGCQDVEISDPGLKNKISVIFKDYGCVLDYSSNTVLSKKSDETEINCRYSRNNLELELLFTAQCGAEHKDSVDIKNKIVSVFLTDTSRISALCTCRFKSTIRFNYTKQGKLKVKFYYKHFDDFFLMTEKNI